MTYVYYTGGRADHRDETDRRHEGNPDRGDSRDVGGENHGRASGPGSDGSPGDGSSRVECAAMVLV